MIITKEMQSDVKNIDWANDLETANKLIDSLPIDILPQWARLILFRFEPWYNILPVEIHSLDFALKYRDNWKKAGKCIHEIAAFKNEYGTYSKYYLKLAKIVAEIAYEIGRKRPSLIIELAHSIPSLAAKAANETNSAELQEQVIAIINIFHKINYPKDKLALAKDTLMYQGVDDLLWFLWDPLGENSSHPELPKDTYRAYVPEIFELLKAGVNETTLIDRLNELEQDFRNSKELGQKGNNVSSALLELIEQYK